MALSNQIWLVGLLVVLGTSKSSIAGQPISRFEGARTCATCHETQTREWEGSMMHYSAQSPVFQAFELKGRKLTGRFGVHDRQNTTFCLNCHGPTSAYENDMIGLMKHEPVGKALGTVGKEGITCTACHSARKPENTNNPEKGLLGDSLANADFEFYPTTKMLGPTVEKPKPEPVGYHSDGFANTKKASAYLTSSQFCGSCHNVNVPTPDTIHRTPYQVEQGTYNEWVGSAYASDANPSGKPVSCTDCHMSLYGSQDPVTGVERKPGEYPTIKIAKGFQVERKHALHRFTAASTSLLPDGGEFPRQDSKKLDAFGFPEGQKQLREAMLKKACNLSTKAFVSPDGGALNVNAIVTNTGAGHHVPTGLSQERELWLELRAFLGADTNPIFESGKLSGSGDLGDVNFEIDPETMTIRRARMESDFNLRPFAPQGLAKFSNAFLKRRAEADYEHVIFFSLADHIDNTRSLPVLKPIAVDYQIPLAPIREKSPNFCGEARVEIRLLYRSFRPKLLQALAASEPSLITKDRIDRNEIVEMNRSEAKAEVCLQSLPATGRPTTQLSLKDQTYRFERAGKKWIAGYSAKLWEEAKAACIKQGCRLASGADYDSLGLAEYVPAPGDNQDELWRARWTGEEPEGGEAKTYTFGWKDERVQSRRVGKTSLETFPYFCACPEVEL